MHHTEEFYEVTDTDFDIPELNRALITWELVYNTIRPHQALGYLTPKESLECYRQNQGFASKVILRSKATKNPLLGEDSTDSSLPLRCAQGYGSE